MKWLFIFLFIPCLLFSWQTTKVNDIPVSYNTYNEVTTIYRWLNYMDVPVINMDEFYLGAYIELIVYVDMFCWRNIQPYGLTQRENYNEDKNVYDTVYLIYNSKLTNVEEFYTVRVFVHELFHAYFAKRKGNNKYEEDIVVRCTDKFVKDFCYNYGIDYDVYNQIWYSKKLELDRR